MRGHAKHRRSKKSPFARGIAAVGITGSAALALPLAGATTAGAVTPQAAQTVAVEKAAARVAQVAQVAKAPGTVRYSVVAGDSLSKIARKYAVKGGWKKVYRDNRSAVGADPALIRPGMRLTVDATGAALSGVKRAAAPTATKASTGAGAGAAVQAAAPAKATSYPDNLDGWIREALDIMAKKGIPGSYDGIHRNIMRESSGNPLAINNWDSNALAGTPSKGLLQVIDPTFRAYHVEGTANDPYDPVANITAACNYAADRYGSIDNVFGAY
ncbi:LysM peptidoglycan-binding domain-containing protein [Streptomyces sp. NPDC051921]|uniref:transglycosylase SLT domain-containing protein n=1 Tax=Streptomyces sp. NPDC051921 TaxID=3155806 RepID=UPI003420F48A